MTFTYEDIVSICDAHGIDLPVEYIEHAMAIVNSAIRTQGADDAQPVAQASAFIEQFEIIGDNNESRYPTDEEKFVLREFVLQLFDASARGDLADDAQPVAIYQVRLANGDFWHDVSKTRYDTLRGESRRSAYATRDAAPSDAQDAERYRKLRKWMSSNVGEGWREVTRLAAVACYVDWSEFDQYLDGLPECNVGLCEAASAPGDK